jgi:hypothetical protein
LITLSELNGTLPTLIVLEVTYNPLKGLASVPRVEDVVPGNILLLTHSDPPMPTPPAIVNAPVVVEVEANELWIEAVVVTTRPFLTTKLLLTDMVSSFPFHFRL